MFLEQYNHYQRFRSGVKKIIPLTAINPSNLVCTEYCDLQDDHLYSLTSGGGPSERPELTLR